MPGHTCIVCGNNPSQDQSVSFHRFPSDPNRRVRWLRVFGMDESQLRSQSQVWLINSCFLGLESAFMPLQRSHHLSVGTAWDSRGSLRVTLGMSAAVSVTETEPELFSTLVAIAKSRRSHSYFNRFSPFAHHLHAQGLYFFAIFT